MFLLLILHIYLMLQIFVYILFIWMLYFDSIVNPRYPNLHDFLFFIFFNRVKTPQFIYYGSQLTKIGKEIKIIYK